jgi:hypothetical protein
MGPANGQVSGISKKAGIPPDAKIAHRDRDIG